LFSNAALLIAQVHWVFSGFGWKWTERSGLRQTARFGNASCIVKTDPEGIANERSQRARLDKGRQQDAREVPEVGQRPTVLGGFSIRWE